MAKYRHNSRIRYQVRNKSKQKIIVVQIKVFEIQTISLEIVSSMSKVYHLISVIVYGIGCDF